MLTTPGGESGFLDDLAEIKHGGGGVFGGFENHRVAGGQCRADLDRHEEKLRVPRHHGCDHAERFAHGEDAEIRFVDRHGVAVHLVGAAGEVVEEL